MRHKYFLSMAVLLSFVSLVALMSRHYGWYFSFAPTDKILHTASGMGFGFLYLWWGREVEWKSNWFRFFSIVGAAVLLSFIWEIWEFAGHYFLPASAQFYKPELGDTLGDMGSGALGGLITHLVTMSRRGRL